MSDVRCPGCGVLTPPQLGPTHRYMESSPGCWALYCAVLEREYSDPSYMAVHRLTVDAYAVQHPGRPSPQSQQSVGAHLVALHGVLERGWSLADATRALGHAVERVAWVWLDPPSCLGERTVETVLTARDADEHAQRVRTWAASAYAAWAPHHPTVAAWADLCA